MDFDFTALREQPDSLAYQIEFNQEAAKIRFVFGKQGDVVYIAHVSKIHTTDLQAVEVTKYSFRNQS